MRRWLAAALLLLLVGCSSHSADVSAAAATALATDVARLSTAAKVHDDTGVRSAVVALRAQVSRQQASGDLSASRAATVLAAAARVAADVLLPSPAPTVVPASPRPVVAPSAPADGGKHEGKGGEDHGN